MISEEGYLIGSNDFSVMEKIAEHWNDLPIYPTLPNSSTKKTRAKQKRKQMVKERQMTMRQAKQNLRRK